jgi:hypothetical protein
MKKSKKKFDIYNRSRTKFRDLSEAHCRFLRRQKFDGLDYWSTVYAQWRPMPDESLFDSEAYRVRPPKKVFVHVTGGVAYVDRVPKGVTVKIIDHDNERYR